MTKKPKSSVSVKTESNTVVPGASLREAILAAAPAIVESLIEQASQGSCMHAKFLFEFGGIEAAPRPELESEGESLASLLRRELSELQACEAEAGFQG